jgi:hypothetical protein
MNLILVAMIVIVILTDIPIGKFLKWVFIGWVLFCTPIGWVALALLVLAALPLLVL